MVLLRKVKRDVALSPVARAVALANLVREVRALQLALYMKLDGADIRKEVLAANELVSIVMRVLERQGRTEEPDYRVMRGCMSAMVDVSAHAFAWRVRHAVPVDEGLRRALDLFPTLPAAEVKNAWVDLSSVP